MEKTNKWSPQSISFLGNQLQELKDYIALTKGTKYGHKSLSAYIRSVLSSSRANRLRHMAKLKSKLVN